VGLTGHQENRARLELRPHHVDDRGALGGDRPVPGLPARRLAGAFEHALVRGRLGGQPVHRGVAPPLRRFLQRLGANARLAVFWPIGLLLIGIGVPPLPRARRSPADAEVLGRSAAPELSAHFARAIKGFGLIS